MPRLKRTGTANRLIVRNSKVYASTLNRGEINGLFAYRDLQEGEILCPYEGTVLTQREANASDSQYLFDVFFRSKPGGERVVMKTIDGQGQLMGYANHAPDRIANATAVDALPMIIDNEKPFKGRHALLLVSKAFIRKGTEVRFDYNLHQGSEGEMVQMMRRKGVTEAQLNDTRFLTTRYITPPERNHAGVVEKDFPYEFIGDLKRVFIDLT